MCTENINRRGLMFVISAPSGVGKTTIIKLLLKHDKHLIDSVSVTTRTPRAYERHDIDYIFVTKNQFQTMKAEDRFLECAEVFDNYYGTLKSSVEPNLVEGIDVVFDIDWQGRKQLVDVMKDDVTSVYVLPPSKQELLNRLKMREKFINEQIKKRLELVNFEMNHWHEYDYVIINKDIEETVEKLLVILRAERLRKNRRIGLSKFVDLLMNENN